MSMDRLSKVEQWILAWLLKKIVCRRLLPELFFEVRRLSREIWYEDNDPTVEDLVIESFLSEKANFFNMTRQFQQKLMGLPR